MKKAIVFLALGLMLLAGCGKDSSVAVLPEQNAGRAQADAADPSASEGTDTAGDPVNEEIIEIKEKMFIAQTNDIYLNADDYMGKTIRYEGIFDGYEDSETGETYRYVIRYGPGCCPGIDSTAGFEVIWDKGYPQPNDWVEAVGKLESYDEDGQTYLRIRLSSLTVLDTRGAESVTQ